MEIVAGIILALAFLGAYAALIPYKRDFEATVAKLEKQTNARIRLY